MKWAIAFNICTPPPPLLRNRGILQGKGGKTVDFLWGKVQNIGIPKKKEQENLELF